VQASSSPKPGSAPSDPTEQDIFRYRYQHGANLGAIFCLERWLFGSMFEESTSGGSEVDAVKAYASPSNSFPFSIAVLADLWYMAALLKLEG
jgi:alpha-ketoglutarate-dependent taurine dioxygenase